VRVWFEGEDGGKRWKSKGIKRGGREGEDEEGMDATG
jgi:hypothetical protein